MPDASTFQKDPNAEVRNLTIRGRRFRFLVPRTLDAFVDSADVFRDFPLWAKVWEASIVLADHLAALPADPRKRFLEIGGGLGVVGIVAAAFGHRVTLTEYNPDALRFARENARLNLDEKEMMPDIMPLDWNRPDLEGVFDCIVGSEVVYRESDFEPIQRLLRAYLAPGGEAILAEGIRNTSVSFFRQMAGAFDLRAVRKTLRSPGKEIRVILCSMRAKGGASQVR
jgi:SAM-dependent methyltransferase